MQILAIIFNLTISDIFSKKKRYKILIHDITAKS